MALEMMEQNCLICNHPHTVGINVLEKRICLKCEQEIVETDWNDPKYDEYVASLKKLWLGSQISYDK